jgi:hypothetical protein
VENFRITYKHDCAKCQRDFKDMEFVYYMPDDNDSVCKKCMMEIGPNSTEFIRSLHVAGSRDETRKTILSLIEAYNKSLDGYDEPIIIQTNV